MTPMLNTIHNLDAKELLSQLPDDSIHCVVTSPPYWSLRDYGVEGQMGMEDSAAEFVSGMVALFEEVRRVLRPDGVCWVNMGDSYVAAPAGTPSKDYIVNQTKGDGAYARRYRNNHAGTLDKANDARQQTGWNGTGLAPKNRLGMPHRLVFGLQYAGWIWRDEVIWHKPNPMPESARDRTTKSHEYVFMLTKRPNYWYDAEAIREPQESADRSKFYDIDAPKGKIPTWGLDGSQSLREKGRPARLLNPSGRNRRSVFTIPTEATPFAHFATFPRALIEPFILAGCPAKVCAACGKPWVREVERTPSGDLRKSGYEDDVIKGRRDWPHNYTPPKTLGFKPACKCDCPDTVPGIVYDPFMGSGTTALVARRLGRQYLGSEINPEYHALALSRLAKGDDVVLMEQRTGATQLTMFEGRE